MEDLKIRHNSDVEKLKSEMKKVMETNSVSLSIQEEKYKEMVQREQDVRRNTLDEQYNRLTIAFAATERELEKKVSGLENRLVEENKKTDERNENQRTLEVELRDVIENSRLTLEAREKKLSDLLQENDGLKEQLKKSYLAHETEKEVLQQSFTNMNKENNEHAVTKARLHQMEIEKREDIIRKLQQDMAERKGVENVYKQHSTWGDREGYGRRDKYTPKRPRSQESTRRGHTKE